MPEEINNVELKNKGGNKLKLNKTTTDSIDYLTGTIDGLKKAILNNKEIYHLSSMIEDAKKKAKEYAPLLTLDEAFTPYEIKKQIVLHCFKDKDFSGKTNEYISAFFDTLEALKKVNYSFIKEPFGQNGYNKTTNKRDIVRQKMINKRDIARQKMIKRKERSWKTPK